MKLIKLFILLMIMVGCSLQSQKDLIVFSQCIDGDTARFETVGKVRFLYIDTPELQPSPEPFAQEAADFTCSLLTNASSIYIEYDGKRQDQYDRVLGWIWVDGALLQEELVRAGLVNKFYDYENVKYKERIKEALNQAKQARIGFFK